MCARRPRKNRRVVYRRRRVPSTAPRFLVCRYRAHPENAHGTRTKRKPHENGPDGTRERNARKRSRVKRTRVEFACARVASSDRTACGPGRPEAVAAAAAARRTGRRRSRRRDSGRTRDCTRPRQGRCAGRLTGSVQFGFPPPTPPTTGDETNEFPAGGRDLRHVKRRA